MTETPRAPGGRDSGAPPHPTSLAVWAVPSPVVVNSRFTVTVGVKCASACPLAGQRIVVRDEAGVPVGEGRLGETPAPGTRALYAADLTLTAPPREGVHSWSARFEATVESDSSARAESDAPVPVESASPAPAEAGTRVTVGPMTPETGSGTVATVAPGSPAAARSEPHAEAATPHAEARATFGFRTAGPPQHRVLVTVLDRDTEAPLRDVEVRLGVYRASTGEGGRASVDVPGGRYDLYTRKAGYAPHTGSVAVDADVTLRVTAAPVSDTDLDDDQVWM